MLSPDQQDFYNRWLQKADNIVDEDVASLIDKYVTLFINYNFLYNIVPIKKLRKLVMRENKLVTERELLLLQLIFLELLLLPII
ncbi:hypothetical protein LWM68_38090 [Niabella sp. W65]|nr:hypothetical protein [Niabella sp. W65]MCH7368039.1 hypothetical protein [Niabella sp. W65]ULT43041.1 hypothetical protein KRR40_05810 [Niabella sp. I65]